MSRIDSDLGPLTWNAELDWWEGTIRLSSPELFRLYVFARSTPEQTITNDAHSAIRCLRTLEDSCRRYAATELLAVHNEEWAENGPIKDDEFMRRLVPDSLVIHESGYAELHFGDGDLFWGHGVGVRIRPDGSFQEAVVEG